MTFNVMLQRGSYPNYSISIATPSPSEDPIDEIELFDMAVLEETSCLALVVDPIISKTKVSLPILEGLQQLAKFLWSKPSW